ncbi:MAG: Bax inhibitor-1/YccA family protein [Candidatus Caenarcaniphilales bacterium]|nr:Bax inhibitor-1/YccA family protein [Candidatus Caenarcaniphilales bacterium]
MELKSSNPALKDGLMQPGQLISYGDGSLTIQGTINKTFILSLILIATGAFTWQQCAQALASGNTGLISPYLWGGAIVGLILGFVTAFKREWCHITAPLYAAAQGVFLGAVSLMYELQFSGLVFQAVLATIGTLFAMLFAYRTGMLKATETFRKVITLATMGVGLLYLISFGLSFFLKFNLPIFESGLIGIGFSIFVVALAALNLILDFDFIEQAAAQGVPKQLEWYGAFGLMVTLIWLYLELLRLLSKLRSRR